MKNCPHCGIEHQGGKSFGAHITNCKENPKRKDKLLKIGISKRIIKNEYTSKCLKCNDEYKVYVSEQNYLKGNYKKYCSRKCANSHNRTEESKKKTSLALIKDPYIRICDNCNIEFKTKNKKVMHCSSKCVYENPKVREKLSNSNTGKCGGYREKGGRGKQGWYKGIFCNSSWELAYVIYCIDNNIKIVRNKEGFNYIFNNKTFKFYPDFIVNGEYVEIKGYLDEKNKAKISQFSKQILIIDKISIIPYIKYVEEKYSKDFINLYE